MNKEKAEQLYNENNSEIKLSFDNYYKYSFNYSGQNKNIEVNVSYGGDSDYIYRYEVDRESISSPKTFNELMNDYYYVKITDRATGEEFIDYHY